MKGLSSSVSVLSCFWARFWSARTARASGRPEGGVSGTQDVEGAPTESISLNFACILVTSFFIDNNSEGRTRFGYNVQEDVVDTTATSTFCD